jgi:hypothetical protein
MIVILTFRNEADSYGGTFAGQSMGWLRVLSFCFNSPRSLTQSFQTQLPWIEEEFCTMQEL